MALYRGETRIGGIGNATTYVTQEEYDCLPSTKLTNNVNYGIYEGDGTDNTLEMFIKNGVCYCMGGGAQKAGYIDVLMVGGGGGGGYGVYTDTYDRYNTYTSYGGGGGGGQVVYCERFPILESSSIPVTVGGGGGQTSSGGTTCFCGMTAMGGGRGGTGQYNGALPPEGGASGGGGYIRCRQYGGGGSVSPNPQAAAYGGASGTYGGDGGAGGQGTENQTAIENSCLQGGGGGGICGNGCLGSVCNGQGGAGYCSSISGSNQWYSGGGGGSHGLGSNGGGNGVCSSSPDSCNATTYGSGGGSGGVGCQGVVIIRYKTDGSCGVKNTSAGGCKYTCGDYTIHCFTDTASVGSFVAVLK